MRMTRSMRRTGPALLCVWLLLLLTTLLAGCAGEAPSTITNGEPAQGSPQLTATSVADGGAAAHPTTTSIAFDTSSSVTTAVVASTAPQAQPSTTTGATTTTTTVKVTAPTPSTTSTSEVKATTTTSAPSDPYPLTCTLLVDCKNAVNVGAASKATILAKQTVKFKEGETVFDVLRRTLSEKGIAMVFQGSGSSVYVSSINGLAEFDGGRWSGWMYNVNGWYPNYSAGVYKLKSDEAIEWRYTCDLGKDLGQHWLGDDITQGGDGD